MSNLRFDKSCLTDMGELGVKRVAGTGPKKIANEVVVKFSSVEVRDAVKQAAKELAGTSAGIRFEIPAWLQPSLKTLESLSYNLKQKNTDMRRNIKFDDHAMDLVIDFCPAPDADPRSGRESLQLRPTK